MMISHKIGLFLFTLTAFPSLVKAEIIKNCDLIRQAKSYGAIDPTLTLAVSQIESSGNSDVVTRQGPLVHYGVMQLQLGTARMLGFRGHPKDLLKWKINLKYGVNYLNEKLKKHHSNRSAAAAAYNAGAAYPCKHQCQRRGSFVNQKYVDLVMAQYRKYANLKCADTTT